MSVETASNLFSTQLAALQQASNEDDIQNGLQTPAYAATVTPTLTRSDTFILVGTLTGNIVIGAPLGNRRGMKLHFVFAQDAVGGRTITWNGAFAAAANGAGGANEIGATSFISANGRWVQIGGALTFKA